MTVKKYDHLAIALMIGLLFLAGCGTTAPGAPSTTTSAAAKTSDKKKEPIVVPDVSGMNHQQAQDTMQAAGLYNLREVDGKGLGRVLVVDKNWVQTGQSPAAGTKVDPDTVITLTAVKNDEK